MKKRCCELSVKKQKEKVGVRKAVKVNKSVDSLGNVNFSDLCIHSGFKYLPNFKCLDFKKYDEKGCPYTPLKLYGTAMAQYGSGDKLLVQTFPKSIARAAFSWYTKVDMSKVKQ